MKSRTNAKFCVALFIIFFLPVIVTAKDVKGILNGNVTWSGDIHVTGDVLVDSDAVLTILPGTKIRFAANTNAQSLLPILWPTQPWTNEQLNHIWLIVKGRLNAVGTSTEIITFTSDSSSPDINDWNGIAFTDITDNSVIQNCVLEYSNDGITQGSGESNYTITVRNNIIRYSEVGIQMTQVANVNLQYNTIYGNGEGVEIDDSMNGYCKNLTLKNNIIVRNSGIGMLNQSNCDYTSSYNNVWNNTRDYWKSGSGNIDHLLDIHVDPLFVSYPTDVNLKKGSPCLKASDNNKEIGFYGGANVTQAANLQPIIGVLLDKE